jgi:hypothetical protein
VRRAWADLERLSASLDVDQAQDNGEVELASQLSHSRQNVLRMKQVILYAALMVDGWVGHIGEIADITDVNSRQIWGKQT